MPWVKQQAKSRHGERKGQIGRREIKLLIDAMGDSAVGAAADPDGQHDRCRGYAAKSVHRIL